MDLTVAGLRRTLLALNIILALINGLILAIAIWVWIDTGKLASRMEMGKTQMGLVVVLVVCGVRLFVAITCCFGILEGKQCLVVVYLVFGGIIVLLQVTTASALVHFKPKVGPIPLPLKEHLDMSVSNGAHAFSTLPNTLHYKQAMADYVTLSDLVNVRLAAVICLTFSAALVEIGGLVVGRLLWRALNKQRIATIKILELQRYS